MMIGISGGERMTSLTNKTTYNYAKLKLNHMRIWWHWHVARIISSQKIYGLNGLKHQIVEISGDVTDAGQTTNERTNSEDRATHPMDAGGWVSQFWLNYFDSLWSLGSRVTPSTPAVMKPVPSFRDQAEVIPDICPWRKKLSCGEICPHDRFSCGQILHTTDCHVDKFLTWQIVMWKNSPHEKCEDNL